MDLANMGAIAALLSAAVAFVAAWWSKRGAERAADHERAQWQRGQLADATTEFLRATDALFRTVRRLPDIDHEQRGPLLGEHSRAVEEAYAPVELTAPPDLLSPAKELLERCRYLERVALDRSVLRSAVSALEAGWCPRDVETCDDDRHGAASVAWDLLTGWADKEDEERWRDRDLLDYCLRESGTLSDAQVDRTLALADRCPAVWNRLIGGWAGDPLMERAAAVREAFVGAARTGPLSASSPTPG